MNHKCWECGKELAEEEKTKRLLCEKCEEEIRKEYGKQSNS